MTPEARKAFGDFQKWIAIGLPLLGQSYPRNNEFDLINLARWTLGGLKIAVREQEDGPKHVWLAAVAALAAADDAFEEEIENRLGTRESAYDRDEGSSMTPGAEEIIGQFRRAVKAGGDILGDILGDIDGLGDTLMEEIPFDQVTAVEWLLVTLAAVVPTRDRTLVMGLAVAQDAFAAVVKQREPRRQPDPAGYRDWLAEWLDEVRRRSDVVFAPVGNEDAGERQEPPLDLGRTDRPSRKKP